MVPFYYFHWFFKIFTNLPNLLLRIELFSSLKMSEEEKKKFPPSNTTILFVGQNIFLSYLHTSLFSNLYIPLGHSY